MGCEIKIDNTAQTPLTFNEAFNKVGEVTFENVIFGSIRIQRYQDGFLIMDADRERFEWFSSDGEHIKTIGNEGKGPGEFVRLQAFDTDTSGNLYAFDSGLVRFSVFDSEGNYRRSFTLKDDFRAHEIDFFNGRLYAFRGYTHEGMPTYISEIDHENDEILNSFFSPPPLLDKLGIPISGSFQNMSISENIITVVHPLLFQIRQYHLDGTLVRKEEGESLIYKKPDPDYRVPAPLHQGVSAVIQTNFSYGDTLVIGLNQLTDQGGGDYFIELYDKAGNKINKKSIKTEIKYLLHVDEQGRYYFKKQSSDSSYFMTLELFKLADSF